MLRRGLWALLVLFGLGLALAALRPARLAAAPPALPTATWLPGREVPRALPIRDLGNHFLGWTRRGDEYLGVSAEGLKVFDMQGGVRLTLKCPAIEGGARARASAASPDGRLAAVLTDSGEVCVWDLGWGAVVHTRRSRATTLALGDEALALGHADGHVEVRDPRSGKRTWGRNFNLGAVSGLRFDRAGTFLLVGGGRRGAAVVDPRSGRLVRAVGRNPTHAVSFDEARERLLLGGAKGKVEIFDRRTWLPAGALDLGGGDVLALDASEDGASIAVLTGPTDAGTDALATVWDVAMQSEVFREPVPMGPGPMALAWTPHANRLVADNGGGWSRLWARPEVPWRPFARSLVNPPFHRPWVDDPLLPLGLPVPVADSTGAVAVSADGAKLVRRGPGPAGEPRLELLVEGQVVPLTAVEGVAEAPDFTPDGRRLAARDGEGRLVLWDAQTGEALARVPVPAAGTLDFAGSRIRFADPEGRVWVGGGDDRAFRVLPEPSQVNVAVGDPKRPERLVLGRKDGLVTVVESRRGAPIRSVQVAAGPVVALTVSADGMRVAFAAGTPPTPGGGPDDPPSSPGAVLAVLHDQEELATDAEPFTVRLPELPRRLAFAAKPEQILALAPHGVQVIDARTGVLRLDLRGAVEDAGLSADGRTLTVIEGGVAWRVPVGEGPVPWLPRGHLVALSEDMHRSAVVDGDVVEIWHGEDGHRIAVFPPAGEAVTNVEIEPGRRWIAMRYAGGDVEIWDLATRQPTRRMSPTTPGLSPWLRFSEDGEVVWTTVGVDGVVGWKVADGTLVESITVPGATHLRPEPRPLSRRIVTLRDGDDPRPIGAIDVGTDAGRRLWQPKDGRLPIAASPVGGAVLFMEGDTLTRSNGRLGTPAGRPISLPGFRPIPVGDFDADGKFFAVAGVDRVVRIFDTYGVLSATLGADAPALGGNPPGDLVSVRFQGSTGQIWTTDDTGLVRRWDRSSGGELGRRPEPPGSVRLARITANLAVAPNGLHLWTGHADGLVRGWDLRSGAQVALFTDHNDDVTALAVSPDGRRVLTGAADGTVRVLAASDLAEQAVFNTYGETTRALAASPDGAQVAAWGDGHVLRLWDLASRRLLARWALPEGPSRPRLSVGADGLLVADYGAAGRLAFSQVDGTVRSLPPGPAPDRPLPVVPFPGGPAPAGAASPVPTGSPGPAPAAPTPAAAAPVGAASSPEPPAPFEPPRGWPLALDRVVAAQGRVVEAGEDGRLRVWDPASRLLLAELTPLTDGSWVVDRADGRRLSSPSLRDETAPPARLSPAAGVGH